MALTVGFDATSALRQRAGIGRYTRELLAALAARNDATRYRLFCSAGGELQGWLPPLGRRFAVRPVPLSDRITNAIWHRAQLPVPVQAATGSFDVFHSPDFTLPPVGNRPSILTVHDLAFLRVPECAVPSLRRYLEQVVPASVRRATAVIAVSESTRRDLIELIDVPEERVHVIHEAAGVRVGPGNGPDADALPALLRERPFILTVGTIEPRKNYPRLLEAYAALRRRGVEHALVIAGARGWLYEPVFVSLDRLRLRPHVYLVRPDDRTLAALYRAADVFVYPTLYEGFGIPPLEALSAGCAVACSSSSSLPEVVGEVALLFDPNRAEEIAAAVERILSDSALAARLRAAGPAQAARFSWERAAAETHALYRQVVGDA
jgi:glycosyltransferase involved in cell wall biosynthesis